MSTTHTRTEQTMASTATNNPYERAARAEKAAKLALYLRAEFGADALVAAQLATESQWECIAIQAGTHLPSEATRERVRELLAPTPADLNDLLAGPRVRRAG